MVKNVVKNIENWHANNSVGQFRDENRDVNESSLRN